MSVCQKMPLCSSMSMKNRMQRASLHHSSCFAGVSESGCGVWKCPAYSSCLHQTTTTKLPDRHQTHSVRRGAYWVHGLSRIRLCLVASIECPVGDSAKTRQFASSDMLVNLMIQPVSSCCLRFQWYRLPALSLERLPVESSVYMGNGWFGYAVMLWVITVTTYVCLQPVLVESSVHMGNG